MREPITSPEPNAAEEPYAKTITQAEATGKFSSELTPEALVLRQHNAYKMRLAGAAYDDIAGALKISRSTAARDVKVAHEGCLSETTEGLALMRQQEAARLDVALFAVMPKVKRGDLLAVDRLIALSKRRSDLLGLDAPKRVELTGKNGGPVETEVNIREQWSPAEARERTQEMVRRLQVAERETSRPASPLLKVIGMPQTSEERN